MNLNRGDRLVQVMIASKGFGEINPGGVGLQQLELAAKRNLDGTLEAEIKIGCHNGTRLYKFPGLDEKGLQRVRMTLKMYASVTNQPGVFREYDFTDCRNEEEMRYRYLLIPEYRAVTSFPKQKVVSIREARDALRCPVCGAGNLPSTQKCPDCGALSYKDGNARCFESSAASFFPLRLDGEKKATVNLCKIDYVNCKNGYLHTHITYIEESPVYLGVIYTIAPPVSPVEFNVVLNKPCGLGMGNDINVFPRPYRCRKATSEELGILEEQGVQLFCGTGTEPHLLVSFPVWDYACLEEVASHVNYLLYIYNGLIECQENAN